MSLPNTTQQSCYCGYYDWITSTTATTTTTTPYALY